LDRRELHLWLLAITVMQVMATGMAWLRYPTVFSGPVVLTGPTLRKTFFGFCVLSILLGGYFLGRQLTIRQLRKRRFEDRLQAASGAGECFSFDLRVVNYPEHIATAREMEKAVVSFLPENQPHPHAA